MSHISRSNKDEFISYLGTCMSFYKMHLTPREQSESITDIADILKDTFEGDIAEVCAMLCLLIDRIYTAVIKKYGVKGLESIHGMTQHVLEIVYKDVVDQYLKGGQDDNRDL